MQELVVIRARDGVGDGGEIIDQREAFHPQLFGDQRGADDPRIVGKTDHRIKIAGAAHRPGNRHADRRWQGAALAGAKRLPRGLKAGVIGGVERFGRIKADRPIRANRRDGEARMGAADVDYHQIAHHLFSRRLCKQAGVSRRRTQIPRAAYLFRFHIQIPQWLLANDY